MSPFEEALSSVFGEKANGFSPALKELLEKLYMKGKQDRSGILEPIKLPPPTDIQKDLRKFLLGVDLAGKADHTSWVIVHHESLQNPGDSCKNT